MTSVLPYIPIYRDAVKKLCLEDLGCLSAGEETQTFTSMIKCEAYLDLTPETCFVVVDENNAVVGCVLCCPDFDAFEAAFNEAVLPKAAALSVRRYVDAKLGLLPYAMFRKEYGAHLSLYVKSAWAGLGVDGLLITALFSELRRRHVSGVVTLTEPENEDRIRFLKENGFKKVLTTKFGQAMGLELKEI